jgi:hypothetical protein
LLFIGSGFPRLGPQGIVNLLPSAFISPAPENSVDRTPIGEILGQHSPLAAGAHNVQNGIDDPSTVDEPIVPDATAVAANWCSVMPLKSEGLIWKVCEVWTRLSGHLQYEVG